MSVKRIRVLVVDDSAVHREMIADAIRSAEEFELIATAADGKSALASLEKKRPDVVTLDLQMPGMNGLETLVEIFKRGPIPVIMVSALAKRDAEITLQALESGAIDYVTKPKDGCSVGTSWRDTMLRKLRMAASTDVRRVLEIRAQRKQRFALCRQTTCSQQSTDRNSGEAFKGCGIVLGISTGGPPALNKLFALLRPPLPPIAIVQHMPEAFTAPFAQRLDSVSELSIKQAASGDILRANQVLVAAGGRHLHLGRKGKEIIAEVRKGEPVSSHMPSVDVTMQAAANLFGSRCLGVIMTGMGHDGVAGCAAIRAAGGFVLGQDQASSDVYGMNKAAFVNGHVDKQFSLDELPDLLTRQVRRMFRTHAENPVAVGGSNN